VSVKLLLFSGRCRGQISRYQTRRRAARVARLKSPVRRTVLTTPCTSSTLSKQSTRRIEVAARPRLISVGVNTTLSHLYSLLRRKLSISSFPRIDFRASSTSVCFAGSLAEFFNHFQTLATVSHEFFRTHI